MSLPALAGLLAEAQARVQLRILAPAANGNGDKNLHHLEPATFITIEQASAIGGLTRGWLYRHTKGLKFRQDLSRKCVRFEKAGFMKWLTVASRNR